MMTGVNVVNLRRMVSAKAKEMGIPSSPILSRPRPVLVHFLDTGVVLEAKDLQDSSGMQFSAFTRVTDSKAYPLSLSREGFISHFAKREIRPGKDGKMFAPATFNDTRSKVNFRTASGSCLDFDHGQPTIESVLKLFPGILMVWYSTHSNTAESPRFRVVIPLSRPVNAEDHDSLVQGIKSTLTPELMSCLDPTCFEPTRAHYMPSCPPEHESHAFNGHQDGNPLDVERFIALGRSSVEPATAKQELRPAPAAPRTFEFADPATGEVHDLTAWAAQNSGFDIVAAVDPQYRRGTPQNGKQHIRCPFEDQHTDQGEDTATFVANASPPQFTAWGVHCCHAHCTGRDRLEFLLAMLEKGWLTIDQLQTAAPAAIERRRPPRIYYPVNDILAAPEWSTLLPDERRIAFDLMALAWAEDDGTIADDDWMIARRLGIPERGWMEYRGTLTRTGWLIEIEGRLTNAIVKREFALAQDAYMKAIIGGAMGGKKSAEKRGAATPR